MFINRSFIVESSLSYIFDNSLSDFIVFNSDNSYDVIDVKGVRTKEYITKKKVFEDKYNMKIIEI